MTQANFNINQRSTLFSLVVRQQPCKARLCSFKEKVDRRPIDPPPIIQLQSNQTDDDFLQNPYFFLYATLTDTSGETDLHFVNGNRTTAGTVVQSLHKLKDIDDTDGGFFIFSDISIRLEGYYRLKFTLYEIEGPFVNRMCSIISNVFQVYSPKSFPGMSESTFLTRSFSDQGVRIRIRKEPRSSSSNLSSSSGKRRRKYDTNDTDDDDSLQDQYMELSPLPRNHFSGRSPSPLPENLIIRPTLPSPQEIFRSSPMSMQNILSNQTSSSPPPPPPPPPLFPTTPADDELNNRLFSTRKLPLPLPSTTTSHQQQHNLHDHTITHQSWITPQHMQQIQHRPQSSDSKLNKH